MPRPKSAEERILRFLKFRGAQTAEAVARHLGITAPGARKHLVAMQAGGLVETFDEASGVGRPNRFWALSEAAQAHFPDSHAVLTVEMIAAVRSVFGADGLDRLIGERERQTLSRYRAAVSSSVDLGERVAMLAALRTEEGYMAEWSRTQDGSYLLVENHCPICAAARACQNFCRSELDVFRETLGDGVRVERVEHLLDGSRRCAYRIAALEMAPA